MGQKKLLAKQLKQDASKTWRFIKEKVEAKDISYYFSSRYAQRKMKKIRKDLRLSNLKETFSKKKIRKRIELFKQNYLTSLDPTYSLSPTNVKRKFRIFQKNHKNFMPSLEKGAQLVSGVAISYTLLLCIDSQSNDFSSIKEFLSNQKEKLEQFESRLDEKSKQKTIAKIEKNKKAYKENKKQITLSSIPSLIEEVDLEEKIFLFPFVREESIEESVERRYQKLEGSTPKPDISLKDLLEKGDIETYDLQTAITQNPAILQNLIAGTTNKKLAKAADKVTKRFNPRGRCLEGAQNIFEDAGFPNIISRGAQYWPQRLKGCDDNSACNAYIPLEKNGKYVIISIDNSAYQKSKGSIENRTMREFVKQLSPGTIVITDNVIADEYRSRSYRDLKLMYGKGGRLHGHIAVIDNSHYFKSDGCEPNGPDFSRYGKVVRIPLPRDICIPKEAALEIIRASEVSKREKMQVVTQNNEFMNSIFLNQTDRT